MEYSRRNHGIHFFSNHAPSRHNTNYPDPVFDAISNGADDKGTAACQKHSRKRANFSFAERNTSDVVRIGPQHTRDREPTSALLIPISILIFMSD